MRIDVVNGLLDRGDLLRLFVRDLTLELFFERHYQFDGIEGIRPEVVDERGFVLDFRLIDTELLRDNLLDALFDVLDEFAA